MRNISTFKKFFILIFLFSLSFFIFISKTSLIHADENSSKNYVFDFTNSISEEKINELEKLYAKFISKNNYSIFFVMTNDVDGKSIESYAQDFFNDLVTKNKYVDAGTILAIDLKKRDFTIQTKGEDFRSLVDYRLEDVKSEIMTGLSQGDFYMASKDFVYSIDTSLNSPKIAGESVGISNKPSVTKKNLSKLEIYIYRVRELATNPILYGIAFFIASIVVIYIISSHKGTITVDTYTYEKKGSFKLVGSKDTFMYRNVSRTARSKSKSGGSSGGSGGSFGGTSGKF